MLKKELKRRPGQDVKRYLSGVRLDNRKVLCEPGPNTKYSSFFFII